jgi:hypothetical protein
MPAPTGDPDLYIDLFSRLSLARSLICTEINEDAPKRLKYKPYAKISWSSFDDSEELAVPDDGGEPYDSPFFLDRPVLPILDHGDIISSIDFDEGFHYSTVTGYQGSGININSMTNMRLIVSSDGDPYINNNLTVGNRVPYGRDPFKVGDGPLINVRHLAVPLDIGGNTYSSTFFGTVMLYFYLHMSAWDMYDVESKKDIGYYKRDISPNYRYQEGEPKYRTFSYADIEITLDTPMFFV